MTTDETKHSFPISEQSYQTQTQAAYGEPPRNAAWKIFCHLSALCSFMIPFGNIVAPLIIWLARRDVDSGVREHGRASLNFQITMSILGCVVIGGAVFFTVTGSALFATAMKGKTSGSILTALAANWSLVIILGLTIAALAILNFAMIIINAVRAYDGREPSYWPLFRFIR